MIPYFLAEKEELIAKGTYIYSSSKQLTMGIFYLLIGTAFGAIITYLRMENKPLAEKEELTNLKNTDRYLEKKIKSSEAQQQQLEMELKSTKAVIEQRENEFQRLEKKFSTFKSQLEISTSDSQIVVPKTPNETIILDRTDEIQGLEIQIDALTQEKAVLTNDIARLDELNLQLVEKTARLEEDLNQKHLELKGLKQSLLSEKDAHEASRQELEKQKTSLEELGKKFNADFENIGTKILDELESHRKRKR